MVARHGFEIEHGGGGLEPWIVSSLPTVRYEAAPAATRLKEGERISTEEAGAATATMAITKPECAVCLSEFEEGEEMKALPDCGHAFHSACIDMWLFSHTTCPICRLSLLKKASSKKKSAFSHSPPSAMQSSLPRSALPAGDAVVDLTHLRLESASTSSEPCHITPNLFDNDMEEARDSSARDSSARNSSAALFSHFPST